LNVTTKVEKKTEAEETVKVIPKGINIRSTDNPLDLDRIRIISDGLTSSGKVVPLGNSDSIATSAELAGCVLDDSNGNKLPYEEWSKYIPSFIEAVYKIQAEKDQAEKEQALKDQTEAEPKESDENE